MKRNSWTMQKRALAMTLSAGTLAALAVSTSAVAIEQSGEQRNMQRVGHVDLQGRPAYQPNVIQYPDGRTIAFSGMHNNTPVTVPSCPNPSPNNTLPNPLKGGACEPNGTMIIDVTDPKKPVEKFHIPVPVGGGQSQSERLCLGSDLPKGVHGKVYMLRNLQGSAAQLSGYEVWDVTNVLSPSLVMAVRGLRNTHKPWWECNTGIAYLPGSLDVPAPNRWRQGQSMLIYDWSDPAAPKYIRTFGLPGGQPGATGPIPPSLHGAISAHEHPNQSGKLARAATADDIIGNRVYGAFGVGDDGVMQILDRKKLLPTSLGGTWDGLRADTPTEADLLAPQAGILFMSPDQGGHTSMPVFGLQPPSYAKYSEFKTRDIVLLASEATSDLCQEAPHWSFVVDVTVENSKTCPPGTHFPPLPAPQVCTGVGGPVEINQWQGPMVLSTMSVDPRLGEKYKRGNYCTRGARFGTHSSEENFRNPLYGKLTTIAYFTGGVRVWDIREPQAPVEVGFYVPVANANTRVPDGYMTNNVEIDNRGYIYVVDRNGAGMDILQLNGCAKQIVDKGSSCKGNGDDDQGEND